VRAKIVGAGSIGNHLARACRSAGLDVDMVDVDPAALARAREEIYPQRYGAWDPAIGLHTPDTAPVGDYDLIVIGTPPDSHLPLAEAALDEGCRALLIEKPLCTPDLDGLADFARRARDARTRVLVGYTHSVATATERFVARVREGVVGEVLSIDTETREHWGGILRAHPWLPGPESSYLGSWRRGGGALGEHSHGLHLWLQLARVAGAGEVAEVSATLDLRMIGDVEHDRIALLDLTTETGLVGRCVQDVVTEPASKGARVTGTDGVLELRFERDLQRDVILHSAPGAEPVVESVPTNRLDDFSRELAHVLDVLASGAPSPLDLEHGMRTMDVIAASFRSAADGRRTGVTSTVVPTTGADR
jgi:predicted dehydrogenase